MESVTLVLMFDTTERKQMFCFAVLPSEYLVAELWVDRLCVS